MSTRTYNVRNRADAGLATQPRPRESATQCGGSPPPTRDLPPHITGNDLFLGPSVALYSDIVASRPPSSGKLENA
jgi:hypothetical protein